MTKEQKLDELIKEIEKKDKARGLSDEYLREHHYMTREELGIGEYSYGVIMIPTDFVLDYLKELQEQQEENKKKDKIIDYMIDWIRERSIYAVDSHDMLKQYFERKVEEWKRKKK